MKHNEQTVLRSPFDVQIHKETFINYLEIVILKDGSIEYAVPSHQLKLIDVIAKEKGITHREVADLCPPEFYGDYMTWLCREAQAISVWNNFYLGEPNPAQIQTLIMLMTENLYTGERIEWER